MFPLQIPEGSQELRRPPMVGVVRGEAAVVPWHPHVVMPKMTACYGKSEALLEGMGVRL